MKTADKCKVALATGALVIAMVGCFFWLKVVITNYQRDTEWMSVHFEVEFSKFLRDYNDHREYEEVYDLFQTKIGPLVRNNKDREFFELWSFSFGQAALREKIYQERIERTDIRFLRYANDDYKNLGMRSCLLHSQDWFWAYQLYLMDAADYPFEKVVTYAKTSEDHQELSRELRKLPRDQEDRLREIFYECVKAQGDRLLNEALRALNGALSVM